MKQIILLIISYILLHVIFISGVHDVQETRYISAYRVHIMLTPVTVRL